MENNAELSFSISKDYIKILTSLEKIKDYGEAGIFHLHFNWKNLYRINCHFSSPFIIGRRESTPWIRGSTTGLLQDISTSLQTLSISPGGIFS